MFNGFLPETIDFMWNLRFNNEKQWFDEHKDVFTNVFQNPMKALGNDVFNHMTEAYPDYDFKLKISRIYRDARRVRDGKPYRDNMWFTIEKPSEEWTSTPVFWFELSIEGWSYGLGYYAAKAATMAKLRVRIDKATTKFENLIALLENQNEFVPEGEEYSRKKTAPSAKTQPWYNFKNVSLIHRQENGEELYSKELVDRLISGYKFLMPFYDYFITLDSDPEPKVS